MINFLNKNKILICLVIIITIGTFLRFYNLSTNPPELFEDEITNVSSARSILLTGKDINGHLNLYFYNRVESRSPVYGYLAALSTFALGNNTFAIRFPAALLGIISVIVVFFISKELFNNSYASLFASFITAVIPWQVHYSRVGWEPAATIPFLLIAIYFYLVGRMNHRVIPLSYLSFCVVIFSHRSGEVLAPLILFTLILFNIKNVVKNFKYHFFPIFIFALSLLTVFVISQKDPLLHNRALRISTFNEGVNTNSLSIFTKNYLAHFSYKFLFTEGDPNLRHSTGKNGVLYSALLPFLIIGFISLLKNSKNNDFKMILLWLIIFPLGGSLTNDGVPHATRTLIGGPVLTLIATFGFLNTISFLNSKYANKVVAKLIVILTISMLIIQTISFSKNYFENYPKYSSIYWNYGNKEVFSYLKENSDRIQYACLENINYWDEETLIHYYLPNNKIQILSGTDNEVCGQSGTILVLMSNFEKYNCIPLKTILNQDSEPIIKICEMDLSL